MKMISSHPARDKFHLFRDELHPASAFSFFVCVVPCNKMARKQLILIEISFCLVTVLLQLQSVLLFHQRIVSSRGEKGRVFTWNFHPERTVYMEISIPGCNLVPVLGTGMSSTRDELIPSPNHVNCNM